jgi:hypothetical protein
MATYTVRQDGSGTHTEIQAAIYDASPGDTVNVGAGTWNVNLDLYKGIILEGAGMESTIIQGSFETNFVKSPGYTCTLGSTTLNFAGGTAGLLKGRLITGTGIPANARIASVSATSITISAATTAARSTATNATMVGVSDATIRVRGSGPTIRNMKFIGYDNASPAVEVATIYLRNTGNGSAAASNYTLQNCHFVANGEYALLTDFAAGVSNGSVTGCKFTGKTFVGTNPATGNQYSVWNVPRQLVVFQSANTGTLSFTGNTIEGTTGGLTAEGVASYNTAATIDVPGAVISNNTVQTISGYGYSIRARGANAVVTNNTVLSSAIYTTAGLLVSGAGATNSGNFTVTVAPLVCYGLLSAETSSYIFDPKVLSEAGFNKDSTLSRAQLDVYYRVLTPPDLSVPNSQNFRLQSWSDLGWGSTKAEIESNYAAFIVRNMITNNAEEINPSKLDLTTVVVSGLFSGLEYLLPFTVYASQSSANPGASGGGTGTIVHNLFEMDSTYWKFE